MESKHASPNVVEVMFSCLTDEDGGDAMYKLVYTMHGDIDGFSVTILCNDFMRSESGYLPVFIWMLSAELVEMQILFEIFFQAGL